MKINFRSMYGPTDWGWINEQVPILRVEDTSGVVAYNHENNELLAACVFDNWTANSVQAHFALTSLAPLKRKFINHCLTYLFDHMKREYIYVMVAENNPKSMKFVKHIGFEEKTRLKEAYSKGVDYVVLELKKGESKYYTPKEVDNG